MYLGVSCASAIRPTDRGAPPPVWLLLRPGLGLLNADLAPPWDEHAADRRVGVPDDPPFYSASRGVNESRNLVASSVVVKSPAAPTATLYSRDPTKTIRVRTVTPSVSTTISRAGA